MGVAVGVGVGVGVGVAVGLGVWVGVGVGVSVGEGCGDAVGLGSKPIWDGLQAAMRTLRPANRKKVRRFSDWLLVGRVMRRKRSLGRYAGYGDHLFTVAVKGFQIVGAIEGLQGKTGLAQE